MDFSSQLAHSQDVATKVASLLQKRMKIAQEHYTQRVEQAYKAHAAAAAAAVQTADPWTSMYRYSVDFAQRSILFWDTLRQRGNNFIEHTRKGMPPVLNFEYDTIGITYVEAVALQMMAEGGSAKSDAKK